MKYYGILLEKNREVFCVMAERAGIFELTLARKIGDVLRILNQEYHFDSLELVADFTVSRLFQQIMDWDVSIVSQGKYYIAQLFVEEYQEKLPVKCGYDDSEALYWYGYLLTRWCQIEQTTGKEIYEQYNVRSILQAYDVLHTLSIENAIEHIKMDDKRA